MQYPISNPDLTHKAFGIYQDVDGKWMVSVISYNPFDHSTMTFESRRNYWVPEISHAGEDDKVAYENLKAFAEEEFFGK